MFTALTSTMLFEKDFGPFLIKLKLCLVRSIASKRGFNVCAARLSFEPDYLRKPERSTSKPCISDYMADGLRLLFSIKDLIYCA